MGWKWRDRKWVWRRGKWAERDKEDDVYVDEIDSGEEKIFKIEEHWHRLSLTTMENKLNEK